MTDKVGRNDPCPCGSGKKFKKCCEERLTKKKFQAQVLSPVSISQSSDKTSKFMGSLFTKTSAPTPSQPEHQPPHDHPDSALPM